MIVGRIWTNVPPCNGGIRYTKTAAVFLFSIFKQFILFRRRYALLGIQNNLEL